MGIRSIIFRGKRIDNGEWVEGFYVRLGSKGNYILSSKSLRFGCNLAYEDYRVIPETVGQYTGLTDRNGIKIFEGDVVRERGGESCQGYYEIDNVLIVKIPDTLVNFEMSYDCEYKVIGNIHDNPELMGGNP